jgi:hypothetical protein
VRNLKSVEPPAPPAPAAAIPEDLDDIARLLDAQLQSHAELPPPPSETHRYRAQLPVALDDDDAIPVDAIPDDPEEDVQVTEIIRLEDLK